MGRGRGAPRFLARVFAAPHQCLTDESFVILRGGSADAIAAENARTLKSKVFPANRKRRLFFSSGSQPIGLRNE
jgi:hypothetical protein